MLAAGFAEEDHDEKSRHVKGGEEGGEEREIEDGGVLLQRDGEDGILAEETAERRAADEGERADEEGAEGDAQLAGEAAHFPNVLLVMEHDDDGTGAEEEQRLEERVGEKMEHGRVARGEAHRHDHVAELRKRGVGEDAFDVVLLRGDEAGHDRGDDADPGDHGERLRRGLNEEADADEHVNAGGHHGGGVDERGDGRRAFHRVRQPDVEWELRGFADRRRRK